MDELGHRAGWWHETEEFGWIMHTCRDNLSFTSHEKLELTADVVASLVFRTHQDQVAQVRKGQDGQR